MSFFLTASNIKPNYNVTFHNGERNIGRLDFNGGVMVFEGDAEESAQVFFDYLAERFANRLKEERDNEREACAMEAENEYRDWPPFCGIADGEIVANDIAKAIRARGRNELGRIEE